MVGGTIADIWVPEECVPSQCFVAAPNYEQARPSHVDLHDRRPWRDGIRSADRRVDRDEPEAAVEVDRVDSHDVVRGIHPLATDGHARDAFIHPASSDCAET